MYELNIPSTTTTTILDLTQNNKHCKLLNIEDLIYNSSEQYLILCLKLCNLIIKYKCNITTLIDVNKYKQKYNLTTTTTTTTTTVSTPTTSNIIFYFLNEYNNLTNETNYNLINNNINYYYYNPNLINNNHDLLNLHSSHHQQQQAQQQQHNLIIPHTNGTLSFPYSSLTIPLLLLNLNETECKKYSYRESYKLSLFIFGIILSFIILILNGLTLTTIIRTRRLHTITNILIANLSLSDFLSGCSFLYPCILNLLTINALESYNTYLYELACNIRQYYYICLVGYSPMITSMLSSIFTLTLLALEKYIAILKPYLYETLCLYKNKLLPICICLNWFISIIISLLPIMGWNEYHQTTIINDKQKIIHKSYRGFNCTHPQSMPCMFEKIFTLGYILLFTVICCVCALTMLAIYIQIYIIARKHSKQIALQMTHFSNFKSLVKKKNKNKADNNNGDDDEDDDDDDNNKISNLNRRKSLNNKNYEKIIDNNSIINLENINNNNNQNIATNITSVIHPSISLTTYVDLNIDTLSSSQNLSSTTNPIQEQQQQQQQKATKNCLLESSSSSSASSPAPSPIKILNNNNNNERIIKLTSTMSSSLVKPKQSIISTQSTSTSSTTKPTIATTTTQTSSKPKFAVQISTRSLNLSMKAMKTLLILLLGFYICWLPLIIYFLTFATQKYNNLTIYILMFVACINAVIDPIVYGFRNREFYKALLLNFKLKK